MYSIENKSEESRAIQNNSEKHVPTVQFKDNRSLRAVEVGQNTAQLEKKENLTGMPDDLKEGIESLSGFSMDDVRVHYNSSKPATVQALAYTQGTDIHVAPGQEKHLPHEAWHVAQQMAGRVSPTTNINGMPVNDNVELEHEADVMGAKAVEQRVCVERKIGKEKLANSKTKQLLKIVENPQSITTVESTEVKKIKNLIDKNEEKNIQFVSYDGIRYGKVYQKGQIKNEFYRSLGIQLPYDRFIKLVGNVNISFWDYTYDEIVQIMKKTLSIHVDGTGIPMDTSVDYQRIFSFELGRDVFDACYDAQIARMVADPEQGRFTATDGSVYYHIPGRYPSIGKPIWSLNKGKILLQGLYNHGATESIYNINIGGGPKTITIASK